MAEEIPNLWPEAVMDVKVRSPLTILKAQAAQLERMTGGVLRGEITRTESGDRVEIVLDAVAPAAGNLRRRVVTLKHAQDGGYPVWIYPSPVNCQFANSEPELLSTLRDVFSSGPVCSIIFSLLAKSNEAKETETVQGA